MDVFSEKRSAHGAHVVITIKKRDPGREYEFKKEGMEEAPDYYEQNPGHPTLDRIPMIPENRLLRINIRYRGPIRSRITQMGIIWTTHDVSSETKLCDLFQLHYLKGGPQPRGEIFLQQISRHLKHIDGTEKCWWSELAPKRVIDVNWIFEDNEVWLGCSVGGAL